jgi:hypothetical protein
MKKILEYHGIMDIEQTTVARPESNVDENSPETNGKRATQIITELFT